VERSADIAQCSQRIEGTQASTNSKAR